VYGRPATLYVAAFLGSPRMNLLEASVYVHLDRYIALNLGEQALYLPWDDIRARAVSHYHGERIVIGMRAEALTPVAPETPGDVLHGRIRYLEHHGHESLAYLDIGATAVLVDDLGGPVPDAEVGAGRASLFGNVLQKLTGKVERMTSNGRAASNGSGGSGRTSVLTDPGRHHRRPAELAVRLAPYPAVSAGHPLSVQVRMDALHFFDDRGDRIDVGWR
jgi:multiple sugar transport system ATP-binding protein